MNIDDKYLIYYKEEKEVLAQALSKKKLSGTSEIVDEYETKLAEFFGSRFAIAISSGTAALHCALWACNVQRGDEIIVSPAAPIMSALPILLQGAKPVFCDVCKENFGFETEDLKKKISNKTKAVIAVPVWGYPFDLTETLEILNNKNIPLIEDAAQAHGAKIEDKYLGTIGRIGCFSTHDRKILSTGEGGFILTNNQQDYDKIKSFIQFGFMKGTEFGLNYKLSTLQAALGLHRIKQVKSQINKRTENAKVILENIVSEKIREIDFPKNAEPNYYSIVLKMGFGPNNDSKFVQELAKNGIPSDALRYNFEPMYKKPVFQKYASKCDNIEKLTREITTLPCHPNLTTEEIDYIVETVKKIEKQVL